MSPKRLLPLVVILIVLGVLAVLFKRPPTPPQLAEEVGLERLVPPTLHTDSITGFELYRGAQPQEIVRLRQRDGAWVVTSRFDTPGNSTKIQQFLTQLSTLQGELRADSTALLGDFQLTDEQALHLKVYTDTPDKPALYLLVGKGSGGNSTLPCALCVLRPSRQPRQEALTPHRRLRRLQHQPGNWWRQNSPTA
jgi:hypothetical protein